MTSLSQRLSDSPGKVLWLDYTAYAGRLLANGAAPWLDPAAAVAWLRKAQNLLRSDVIAVPLDAVAAAWLAAHAGLLAAMSAKRRAVFPLKTLLADEDLRAHLLELVRSIRGSFASSTVMLVLPSPRRWVSLAYGQALPGDAVEVGDDETDTASMYVADFLRGFGDCAVDGLLLQESTDSAPRSAAGIECYRSVINVAGHYRWDAGIGLPEAPAFEGPWAGIGFALAPVAMTGVATGLMVRAGFWSGEAPPQRAAGGFLYAEIPEAAQPEAVLDRLAALRG